MAGKVVCDDARIDSPALKVSEDAVLRLKGMRTHSWASRGGLKLEHAIEAFGVDVAGALASDGGCSTGGFTDVLITKGAAKARPPRAPPLAGYPRRAARARTPPLSGLGWGKAPLREGAISAAWGRCGRGRCLRSTWVTASWCCRCGARAPARAPRPAPRAPLIFHDHLMQHGRGVSR